MSKVSSKLLKNKAVIKNWPEPQQQELIGMYESDFNEIYGNFYPPCDEATEDRVDTAIVAILALTKDKQRLKLLLRSPVVKTALQSLYSQRKSTGFYAHEKQLLRLFAQALADNNFELFMFFITEFNQQGIETVTVIQALADVGLYPINTMLDIIDEIDFRLKKNLSSLQKTAKEGYELRKSFSSEEIPSSKEKKKKPKKSFSLEKSSSEPNIVVCKSPKLSRKSSLFEKKTDESSKKNRKKSRIGKSTSPSSITEDSSSQSSEDISSVESISAHRATKRKKSKRSSPLAAKSSLSHTLSDNSVQSPISPEETSSVKSKTKRKKAKISSALPESPSSLYSASESSSLLSENSFSSERIPETAQEKEVSSPIAEKKRHKKELEGYLQQLCLSLPKEFFFAIPGKKDSLLIKLTGKHSSLLKKILARHNFRPKHHLGTKHSSLLQYACAHGDLVLLKLLEDKNLIDRDNINNDIGYGTPLSKAIARVDYKITMKLLLKCPPYSLYKPIKKKNNTVLHLAAAATAADGSFNLLVLEQFLLVMSYCNNAVELQRENENKETVESLLCKHKDSAFLRRAKIYYRLYSSGCQLVRIFLQAFPENTDLSLNEINNAIIKSLAKLNIESYNTKMVIPDIFAAVKQQFLSHIQDDPLLQKHHDMLASRLNSVHFKAAAERQVHGIVTRKKLKERIKAFNDGEALEDNRHNILNDYRILITEEQQQQTYLSFGFHMLFHRAGLKENKLAAVQSLIDGSDFSSNDSKRSAYQGLLGEINAATKKNAKL